MPTFDATGRQRWCESPDACTFDAAGRLYTLVLKSGGIEDAQFSSQSNAQQLGWGVDRGSTRPLPKAAAGTGMGLAAASIWRHQL